MPSGTPSLPTHLPESVGPAVQAAMRQLEGSLSSLRDRLGLRRRLQTALRARDPDGILHALRAVPGVHALLKKPTLSPQFQTIEAHTRAVLHNLARALPPGTEPGLDRVEDLFLATALHDIAKGHSVEAFETTEHQHAFTPPAAQRIMQALGYPASTVRFVLALISQDAIGEASRGLIPLQEGVEQMRRSAEWAAMPLQDFVTYADHLYVSDASSYDDVRARAFRKNEQGQYEGTRPGYHALHEALGHAARSQGQTSPPSWPVH